MDSKNDSKILKSKAVQKPAMLKPSIQLFAIKIKAALITNKNKPKVNMVTGKVNTTSIGFKIAKSNPIKTATQIAVT